MRSKRGPTSPSSRATLRLRARAEVSLSGHYCRRRSTPRYTRSMASGRQRRILDAGSRAPDFRLPRLYGGVSALAELAAKGPVVLVFFKVTCPVCQMALPFLERIHAG